MRGKIISESRLIRYGSYYSLQLDKTSKSQILFSVSMPLTNSVKGGINKVVAKLSSMGDKDFSGRQLLEPAMHLLSKPGKLLRPALVFAGAYSIGEDVNKYIDLAVGAELLHTASLVHDDIIDRDSKRRGLQTVHEKYGSETAILAGDALISKAVHITAKYGPETMESLAKSTMDMCAGELLDYTYQKKRKLPNLKMYLKIAGLKSATFMGCCCNAVATHKRNKSAKQTFEFGKDLGMAFQIRDDIIEVVDSRDRRENGGTIKIDKFKPNIVRVIEKEFGKSSGEAIKSATNLNNYFAERALSDLTDPRMRAEFAKYIDFIRIKSR